MSRQPVRGLIGFCGLSSQVVDSITGNYVDQFTYTKPYGWQPNMARQLATINGYKANNGTGYVPVPHESTGTPYAGVHGCMCHIVESWLLCRRSKTCRDVLFFWGVCSRPL